MIKELKKKNLSCKLLPLLKKQLKNQRLRLNVLTQEKINQVPLSILVSSEVDKNKNVVSEDKTEVQSSNSEQKSDLEVYCDITSSCASSVF